MSLPWNLRIEYKQNFNAYCIYWRFDHILCTRRKLALITDCPLRDINEMCNGLVAFTHKSVDYFDSIDDAETLITMLALIGGA